MIRIDYKILYIIINKDFKIASLNIGKNKVATEYKFKNLYNKEIQIFLYRFYFMYATIN